MAGLLVLAAAGLLTLGAVTYAEQKSFLYDRADQQTKEVEGLVSQRLAPDRDDHHGGPDDHGPPPGGGGGYAVGQRVDASGNFVGKPVVLSLSSSRLATPRFPNSLAANHSTSVGSVGSSLKYRVTAFPTRGQPGTTLVAVPLKEATQTLNRLLLVLGLVIGGVLLALGALAWWVVRLGLRPLDRMGATAGAIAAGDLSRRVEPATERTEVGRLGLALNGMLAQIEKAFGERQASENRLRRFLADASHELRTPLASIRGYAELFRIGAARSDAETEKAMGRIEGEAARMGTMVEDMLTLARLDQLPEVSRKPVNLTRLARDAADDARAAAPHRTIEV